MYFEALYNESRNAIPSWQGYNYQGEVAANKYLYYLLNQFRSNSNKLESIYIKIEWLEDFVVFEGESTKEIYQVKKTLTKSDYTEVIQNFILQFKLLNDEHCKWFVIYDDVSDSDLEEIAEEKFNELYNSYIRSKIVAELNLLLSKKEDLSFWKEHLKLRSQTPSCLSNIRGFIRKVMYQNNVKFDKLTKEDCVSLSNDHISKIIANLVLEENDYTKFNEQVDFIKIDISTLKSQTIDLINQLTTEGHLNKSDIMLAADIYELLFVSIYEKLMKIESKLKDEFVVKFSDIQEIFMCSDKELGIWKARVFKAKEEMSDKIATHCNVCQSKLCDECQITKFFNLDFCELIDHCNLEHPRLEPGNIGDSLTNKLSREKNSHLVKVLLKHKDNMNCISYSNFIEVNNKDKKLFVSENISDEHDENRLELINNMKSHIAVYKEYEYILTKFFDDVIDFEKARIVMNTEFITEETPPTFMEVLPVSFVSKNKLEEE